jgi:multiple sugar transport system substrate-binding protein
MFIKLKAQFFVLALVIACSAAVLLSGCGSVAPNATGLQTIMFWSSNTTPSTQQLVDSFNKQNQGRYRIEYTQIPYNNETEIVNSALASHRGPDLLEESIATLATYASLGLVEPIEPYLQKASINPTTDFPPSMWNDTALKGVHYTAPVDATTTLLFYNKALFRKAGLNPDQPPANATQFIHDAQLLTHASSGQWGYVQQPDWPNPGGNWPMPVRGRSCSIIRPD